eukprot:8865410-Karenia_brevis.AAC.1
MAEYMKWVAVDASRHHKLKARIQKYIDDMNANPDKKRIRDADSIRNHQELTASASSGRRVVDKSQQCIPVDKWHIVRPNEALPGEEYQGFEKVNREWVKVVYVLKEGASPFVYDIENYDDAHVNHATRLAELQEDDGSDEDAEMQASLTLAMKAVKDKSSKTKAISLTKLEDMTSKMAEDGSMDEDDSTSNDDGPGMGIGGSLLTESLGMFKGPTPAPKSVAGGRTSGAALRASGASGAERSGSSAAGGRSAGGQNVENAATCTPRKTRSEVSVSMLGPGNTPTPKSQSPSESPGDPTTTSAPGQKRKGRPPMLNVTKAAVALIEDIKSMMEKLRHHMDIFSLEVDANLSSKQAIKQFRK